MPTLLQVITSDDPDVRNISLDRYCENRTAEQLLADCDQLDAFRRTCDNLYERVRALFFLYAIYRFHLPGVLAGRETGHIPFSGYEQLLGRRFPEAIDTFLQSQQEGGLSVTLTSAIAEAYHRLAFQTLANQVRRSVRTVKGNQWMFRTGHPADVPLKLNRSLIAANPRQTGHPILRERTAVRMDFTHSAWSDIFFLGMDYPEGAQVINASVNLAVRGRHSHPQPPIECALRVIDEPVLRLVSIDLESRADISELTEVFDFARDYLGLIKAAVIASGIIPPGMEGCGATVADVFHTMIGPGKGLEIVSRVNDIPKGSRLAVSTNLLGSLISVCMRATGQVSQLTGPLEESDRRIVAARAILGEWIGGSGGGWQDSGGIWPGIKLIQGAAAGEGDPEFGISRGRLMPQHTVYTQQQVCAEARQRLQDSLVLVHGGMAQNVGPILEMVTEKYLLRCEAEWEARQDAIGLLEEISSALQRGDVPAIGAATHRNFHEPLQAIIPWCSTAYTEELIRRCQEKYGEKFQGFWMLGGMSGGGMGFIFDPAVRSEAQDWLQQMMLDVKREAQHEVPFAMDPVVYDFEINDDGTAAELLADGPMPGGYRALVIPDLLKQNIAELPPARQRELEQAGDEVRRGDASSTLAMNLLNRILPGSASDEGSSQSLDHLLQENGFDSIAHEQLREEIRTGRLGLSQNRLPQTARVEDVRSEDVIDTRRTVADDICQVGREAIAAGRVGVMTLAAGVGSRWTQGAGVVKALNPFCRMGGRFRSFLDIHLAKSRQTEQKFGHQFPHIITTGYLTDAPIRSTVQQRYADRSVYVSKGASVGLRMVPTVRDLQFAWEEMPQQVLDEQQEKMRVSVRSALTNWARSSGEAADYRDNLAAQCLHPVGHWYEVPNLLINGTLQQLLTDHPQLEYLMLHNVDTLGANLDPACLGLHMHSGADLSFEVISRRLEDRGGGLARVDGRVRLVEGLAMPREEDEFALSYYNTLTTWISIDRLLATFGLTRDDLGDAHRINAAVRELGARMPTYITLKDVKKRWGRGQEDIFPVSQFEKLWGDMTALTDVNCQFLVVPTNRGQQLKDPAQLDGWLRDGSAAYVESLLQWS
ncbi:MAG: UTP--glucose-1-phosphate uridylyltransferase [Planctomycetaceae bacterium]|nr:UTP--glucose-1-phosphate uridylyltransferase [Planctomycetaceae bacterium]